MNITQKEFYFNSQPHKEADERWKFFDRSRKHFNSQPHKEADVRRAYKKAQALIFQLTASQGGWPIYNMIKRHGEKFQLTASQGGWLNADIYIDDKAVFQLTASQGGWRRMNLCIISRRSFQLTASQGGWRRISGNEPDACIISTHSLTRRLTSYRN